MKIFALLTVVLVFGANLYCGQPENVAGAEKKDVMKVQYNSVGQYPTHGITMAGALRKLGVDPQNIDYLKLVGDEHSQTLGLEKIVKMDEFFLG